MLQIVLSRGEAHIAEALVAVYFSIFKAIVAKKQVDARILSALLTGINRAFPYAQLDQEASAPIPPQGRRSPSTSCGKPYPRSCCFNELFTGPFTCTHHTLCPITLSVAPPRVALFLLPARSNGGAQGISAGVR